MRKLWEIIWMDGKVFFFFFLFDIAGKELSGSRMRFRSLRLQIGQQAVWVEQAAVELRCVEVGRRPRD